MGEWRTKVQILGGKERELQMTDFSVTRVPPRSAYSRLRTGKDSAAGWLGTVISDRNLIILAAFCLIGLLVTLNLIFRFPVFQPSIDEFAQILG
jgi:hypothetical protein